MRNEGAPLTPIINRIRRINRISMPMATRFCRRNERSGVRYSMVRTLSMATNKRDPPQMENIRPIARITPASSARLLAANSVT